jgi:hypothetical protein
MEDNSSKQGFWKQRRSLETTVQKKAGKAGKAGKAIKQRKSRLQQEKKNDS